MGKTLGKKEPRLKMMTCKWYLLNNKYLSFCIVRYDHSLIVTIISYQHQHIRYYYSLRPEALGIVPGAIFLICLMFCLVGFATNHPSKVCVCVNDYIIFVMTEFIISSSTVVYFCLNFNSGFSLYSLPHFIVSATSTPPMNNITNAHIIQYNNNDINHL